MNKNKQELVALLGLHESTCSDLFQVVASNLCPIPRSVTERIRAKNTEVRFLPMGLVSFDQTLRGGLPCGGITEVVGPAGAGKTQFCLQSCVRAIGEFEGPDSAIYLDTVCLQPPLTLDISVVLSISPLFCITEIQVLLFIFHRRCGSTLTGFWKSQKPNSPKSRESGAKKWLRIALFTLSRPPRSSVEPCRPLRRFPPLPFSSREPLCPHSIVSSFLSS